MRRLERKGYGAMFCDLYIDGKTITKCAKNEEGKRKLHRELFFYKTLQALSPNFPIPILVSETDDSYTMHFYSDYLPLYQIYWNTTAVHQEQLIVQVQTKLNTLHILKTISRTKEEYLDSLFLEIFTKPLLRYEIILPILKDYSYTHVNELEIDTFHELLHWIKEGVTQCVETKQSFDMCIIHGDCQFNNILYKSDTKELVFLDPRGYFGNSELFGPVEYDSAKLLFALSGYDIFDSMEVSELKSEGDTLLLPALWKDESIFQMKGLETFLFLSIWLSNAHSFLSNPKKVVFSYYYALYIASLVKRSASDDMKKQSFG